MSFIAVLLPLFLFFFVEMNHLWSIKDKAQYINDNMANASVRSINKELLAEEGIIEIIPSEAELVAENILKESYQLNDDFSLPEKSFLKESPILKVYTINHSSVEGIDFETDEGRTFKIYEPTIIVYSSIKPKGVFFNKLVDMQSYSLFQIKTNPNIPIVEDSSDESNSIDSGSGENPGATVPTAKKFTIPAPDISHIPDQQNFTGWRRIIGENGTIFYEGTLRNGKFNNYGVLYRADGTKVYEGAWSDGIYNGHGTIYNADGSIFYSGQTSIGVPNGFGAYYGSDGVIDYEGQFENGYREGWGTNFEEDGSSSSGNHTDHSAPPEALLTPEHLMFEKIY